MTVTARRRIRWLVVLGGLILLVAAWPQVVTLMAAMRTVLTMALAAGAHEVTPERLAAGRRAAAAAVAESAAGGGFALVVEKSSYTLVVYQEGQELRRLPVELGLDPRAVKQREGDLRTPEGLYRVTWRRERGETDFYRALLLDYPNAEDVAAGRTGSHIEIHGLGSGRRPVEGGRNWTRGCVALANEHVDELFALAAGDEVIGVGTPVAIAWQLAPGPPLS